MIIKIILENTNHAFALVGSMEEGIKLKHSIILNIKNMNQFYNDLKKLIKTHWETIVIIIIILLILIESNYSDIKSGILDAW